MADSKAQAQLEFFIAKGDDSLGPWSIEEIVERIGRSELLMTDFVYDDGRADWIPLMECAALQEHLRKSKPKAPPPKMKKPEATAAVAVASVATVATVATVAIAEPIAQALKPAMKTAISELATSAPDAPKSESSEEWFVQKGANRYGPMSYFGLVRALQEKTVYDFDFVWQNGMETWVRIAEHPSFQAEKIKELAGSIGKEQTEVFFRRQYARVRFESEVIVHDDQSVWMGQAFEASAGGSGLMIENSTLAPGQVVRLHFAPCNGLPAFNALGEIVGKKYQKEVRGAKSPVRYAVRFLKLDGSAEPQVREYFASQSQEQAS
jgi:hypothetical protein